MPESSEDLCPQCGHMRSFHSAEWGCTIHNPGDCGCRFFEGPLPATDDGAATRRIVAAIALALALALAAPAAAAESRACDPIVNPYEGTRYEGTDIRKIRAVGTSCSTARSVARGAHRKALGMTPPPSGVRRFEYKGWKVTGDLRGDVDRYLATRGGKRVRWVF